MQRVARSTSRAESLSRSATLIVLLAVFCALLCLHVFRSVSSAGIEADVTGEFGAPRPGLSARELERFVRGREVFVRRFKRADGVGPHFNATSCTSCHEDPEPGGSSQRYRDFFLVGRYAAGGMIKVYPDCDQMDPALRDEVPCLPSIVMPHYGPKGTIAAATSADVEHPKIPADADVVARRNAPPLFGVGLFSLVSAEEIASRADPDDVDGDGISGRVHVIPGELDENGDPVVGRFGYKCQTASVEAFNRGALHNQMGITSDPLFIAPLCDAGRPRRARSLFETLFLPRTAHAQVAVIDRITDHDEVPDPEIDPCDLDALVFFQENLAAPRRGPIDATVDEGEMLFRKIGCASCHLPSLETELGIIHPYTDLLLHDMGEELADGVIMGDATGSEFRTQPLWGLCEHAPFLHDGRADTISGAILLHGGEATAARAGYVALDDAGRRALHRFLESL